MKTIHVSRNFPVLWTWLATFVFVAATSFPMRASAESPSPLVASAAPKPQRTYTPKAGEKLDRVIQQTMANSPLKIEILRKAFVDLNPHAFVAGNANQMRKGAVLQIPDVQHAVGPAIPSPAPKEAVVTNNVSGPMSGSTDERRHWVRYP